RGEDAEEFEAYRQEMVASLAPVGALEAMLAGRIVGLSWRLLRAERHQNDVYETLYLKEASGAYSDSQVMLRNLEPRGPNADLGPAQGDLVAGQVVRRDCVCNQIFERLLMYERRIEQSLYRAMAELEKLRRLRQSEPPAGEPKREVAEEPSRQTKPNGTSEIAERSSGGDEERRVAGGNGETKPNVGTGGDHPAGNGEVTRTRMSPDGESSHADVALSEAEWGR
ncbi:MAG: hypothetical protein JW993_11910, partial [Sedimentisphaerales bacterium]|nr:hypothetical protein [Sedimentisphaerales bacterium]